MKTHSADTLAKIIISIQAILIPVLLLAGAWLTLQNSAQAGSQAGPGCGRFCC
ncbi:hypothetical protein MBH78_18480 [Oceanimonas sp. NS1]|nr:hypothetical protein [Oceanimonas sp. NS1]